MNTQEFLNKTYEEDNYIGYRSYQVGRPRIVCNDGFSMSVQAGELLYSTPQKNGKISYSAVEVGFPSEEEELLSEFAENKEEYTETVYPYVKIGIVDNVIKKHGGINIEKTF